LATNFQDLVANAENLGALAPVLGTISGPELPLELLLFEMSETLIIASACRKNFLSPKAFKPTFACVVHVALR